MKKVSFTMLLAVAVLFGAEAAGQSSAYAQDVWIGGDNYADHYIMTETISKGSTYRAYVKYVSKNSSYWSKTGLEFFYDEGDWWYRQFDPRGERTFRVYGPHTDAYIGAALEQILNN